MNKQTLSLYALETLFREIRWPLFGDIKSLEEALKALDESSRLMKVAYQVIDEAVSHGRLAMSDAE